jgi:arthrofactin-type cyclic lipopeptide synthetase C
VLSRAGRSTLPEILPAPRDQRLPLSFAQQRLWFLAQMDGGHSAYNIPVGLRLRGRLDEDALQRALARIVARHETLRSRFSQIDDQPQVLILPAESGLLLAVEDLRQHPQADNALRGLIEAGLRLVQSAARCAAARTSGASGRRPSCAVADAAPHHRRWLVDGRTDP